MTKPKSLQLKFLIFSSGIFFLFVLSFVITIFGGKSRFVDCPFCLKKFSKEPTGTWILIYPGLVGCGKKCPLALEALRRFKERFPEIQTSFYFLVTDPSESEEAIAAYLDYYQKSIQIKALRPETEEEISFYRKLGAYMPIHPSLKQRDEHGTQFFLVPPNRDTMYLIPKLGEKEWIDIQKEIETEIQ
ncbi:SCO family protein [Leptospira sp. 85282-16]|uniref:SCO family protein n=1 Tax=Leptospira TaxID=171 RepID=UPI00142D54AC|nr:MULTISPECIES: SCO family protein [Leptospira]MCT8335045.1 SCO family protein [Leptospira sp. 85282-16]